ncbi:MAG: hypothetical protein ACRD4R_06810 [Candidatus Acidiferrales bacterium]
MNWPATLAELESGGYRFSGADKLCDCGTMLLWFITPAGKWIPISSLKDSRMVPHHSVCARVKQFRAANKTHTERANSLSPAPAKQIAMFGGEKSSREENPTKGRVGENSSLVGGKTAERNDPEAIVA